MGHKTKSYFFCSILLHSCNRGDVVDAADGEEVEDDVSTANVQHRQEIKNKTGRFLS